MYRELTRQERNTIRALVTRLCANYDREHGCLPLDGECYMLGKCWTGSYCRYFLDAVLPNDPGLEAMLTADASAPELRACPVCRRPVPVTGRRRYCSAVCARKAHRKQQREHMRRKRG